MNECFLDSIKPYKKHGETYISEVVEQFSILKSIHEDWERFVNSGDSQHAANIRPEILSSWLRSYKSGLSPHKVFEVVLSSEELAVRRAMNKDLIDIAAPILEEFVFNLRNGFRVDLVDRDLYILYQYGTEDVLSWSHEQEIAPGACRAESYVGATAINLCGLLRRPMQLIGSEHYCSLLHDWICSACPIFDDNDELIGIVNVSSALDKIKSNTFAMIKALARAIQYSWIQKKIYREKELSNNFLTSIIGSISDGILAIDKDHRISFMNSVAGKILNVTTENSVQKSIDEIFATNSRIYEYIVKEDNFVNKEITITGANKRAKTIVCSLKSILNNKNERIGSLLVLKNVQNAGEFVKNLAGFSAHFTFEDIHGRGYQQAIQLASKAAVMPSNILLLGESGTGKELFAQAIHNASRNSNGSFVGINCAAIPRELIESELFGYEGGAFTGAKREGQPGKFQLAKNGTLFFDEIEAMPAFLQVKLLRVLQNRKFTKVGGNVEISLEARLVFASNRDLWEEIKKGMFREDLFYRINVITIEIPSLRNHKESLPELIDFFREKISEKINYDFSFDEPSTDILLRYDWPGNVRELENVIERSAVQAYSRNSTLIGIEDVSVYYGLNKVFLAYPNGYPNLDPLEQAEREVIVKSLQNNAGNITAAAAQLGITRKTLAKKKQLYGIQ
ncbi:MAG: sigma 54-interacting transcriptional regulator [Gracilibacteraceae bacterium]|jgi:transcriptional regulator with PAS, ATPase and Fis domain|nr:sigma 54-interacting transcriptional regulator [Gracilibacteraceae bacterium]